MNQLLVFLSLRLSEKIDADIQGLGQDCLSRCEVQKWCNSYIIHRVCTKFTMICEEGDALTPCCDITHSSDKLADEVKWGRCFREGEQLQYGLSGGEKIGCPTNSSDL